MPPAPNELPQPTFGRLAPSAGPAPDLALLATQLQQCLSQSPDGMGIADLTLTFEQLFRRSLSPREYNAASVKALLIKQGAALGLRVDHAPGHAVWITLAKSLKTPVGEVKSTEAPGMAGKAANGKAASGRAATKGGGAHTALPTGANQPRSQAKGAPGSQAASSATRSQRRGRPSEQRYQTQPMHDDGVAYEGPIIRFVRSTGVDESDDEGSESGDDHPDGCDGAQQQAAGAGATAASAGSKHAETHCEIAQLSEVFASAATLDTPAPSAAAPSSDATRGATAIGRDALLATSTSGGKSAALDASTSIGYAMLKRMGWEDGMGLGRQASGAVEPVAVSAARLLEGVGLGCTADLLPENKVLTSNVESMITAFLASPERDELVFDPCEPPRARVGPMRACDGACPRLRESDPCARATAPAPG